MPSPVGGPAVHKVNRQIFLAVYLVVRGLVVRVNRIGLHAPLKKLSRVSESLSGKSWRHKGGPKKKTSWGRVATKI